ncbi:MAG: YqzG/YhdC family protein [Candidatus Pristimantibacillus lignocellulolyticus]|uniref:YqzG/YhdC family protein n=1 Tax=Candidatus Pristimantibacillus lignocellulolyticus TaxID=2994561 RepID=A0A9J6ZIV5_9BACL|nr:MAG: YqzG/YhdC family protein [Candidatus Pristimantibacillus lignocellulolyticus]
MRKLMISLLTLLIMFAVSVEAEPEYAKWGSIAVDATQKRYSADIIDYKYIGRKDLTTYKCEEKFKLWIRNKEGKEFEVYVSIQFDSSTEKIQSIQFSESTQ